MKCMQLFMGHRSPGSSQGLGNALLDSYAHICNRLVQNLQNQGIALFSNPAAILNVAALPIKSLQKWSRLFIAPRHKGFTWYSSILCCNSGWLAARIRTASKPALAALPMATVATGTPRGICNMPCNQSQLQMHAQADSVQASQVDCPSHWEVHI